MAPQTRSKGKAPPSRVYHSSPAPQQQRFPARSKSVKTYSKKKPRMPSLRQTTITQIDFLTPVDPEELERLEKEENQEENAGDRQRRKKRRKTEGDMPEDEDENEGDGPKNPNSSFHTQTLTQFCGDLLSSGAATGTKKKKDRVIRDSEDESDGIDDFFEVERGGKAARVKWASSSTRNKSSPAAPLPHTPSKKRKAGVLEVPSSQPSPFTPMLEKYSPAPKGSPLKSRSTNVGTPMPKVRSVERSALKRTRKLVVEDSYASALTVSPDFSPAKSERSAKMADVVMREEVRSETTEDSNKENRAPEEESSTKKLGPPDEGGEEEPESQKSYLKAMEIADSEDDELEFGREEDEEDEDLTVVPISSSSNEASRELGDGSPSPRRALREDTPSKPERVETEEHTVGSRDVQQELVEVEDDGKNTTGNAEEDAEDAYPIGAETQFVMNLIASGEDQSLESSSTAVSTYPKPLSTQKSAKSTPARSQQHPIATAASSRTPRNSAKKTANVHPSSPHVSFEDEDRSPAHHKTQAYTQMDSQRVDLQVINDMPKPTARSDIFVSIHPEHVDKIVNGTKNHEFRVWKVANTVVRMWIYVTRPESRVRYMASISPAKEPGEIEDESGVGNAEFNRREKKAKYAYELLELYELNNPVSLARMKEYGWLEGPPQKYAFVPPAVVSQLQANLRCQLLTDHDEDAEEDEDVDLDSIVHDSQPGDAPMPSQVSHATSEQKTVSQEVAAQLHIDYVQATQHPNDDDVLVPSSQTPQRPKPSSPQEMLPPPSTAPRTRSAISFATPKRPSRAVPPSQATTTSASSTPSPRKSAPPQAASLPVFHDSVSPVRMPEGDFGLRSSQLVSVSQLLPESLVRDHAPRPTPVVWDSEEGEDEEL